MYGALANRERPEGIIPFHHGFGQLNSYSRIISNATTPAPARLLLLRRCFFHFHSCCCCCVVVVGFFLGFNPWLQALKSSMQTRWFAMLGPPTSMQAMYVRLHFLTISNVGGRPPAPLISVKTAHATYKVTTNNRLRLHKKITCFSSKNRARPRGFSFFSRYFFLFFSWFLLPCCWIFAINYIAYKLVKWHTCHFILLLWVYFFITESWELAKSVSLGKRAF